MITKKTTNELEKMLCSMHSESTLLSFSEELSHSEKTLSFSEYLLLKMRERELSPARLWSLALIQRNYGYQILNGMKAPGRDKVIALCLALSLSFKETQRALTLANTGALYARRIRDSILIFALQKNLSVLDANILLSEYSEEPLS